MTRVDVLPDVPAFARMYLLSQTALTAVVGDCVSTTSKGVFPEVKLQRIGGVPSVRRRLDSARIQVDVLAIEQAEASMVARLARALLHDMEGYATAEAVCTAVDDDLGLAWVPDTARTPSTPRFIFGVVIHAHSR